MSPFGYSGYLGGTSPERDRFSSLGLAPGVTRGYRTWRSDNEGILRGLYYRAAWMPGENLARCRTGPIWTVAFQYYGTPPSYPSWKPDDQYDIPEKGHLPDCRCGLYAYYEGSNDYYNPTDRDRDLVTGMVEGYGETMIGTRGFRAAKARIVALHFPDTRVYPKLILENYPDVPVFLKFEDMVREFPPDKGDQDG